MKVISFDIGGTSIRCALVENNKILRLIRCDTPKNKKDFLKKIVELNENFMEKDVHGIGVGFPSPVKDGVVKNPPNLDLKNFDLKKYLEKKFKKRVEIANDVDCAALAESRLGIRKKNFFVIALGTGIGGGIVIDGEVYAGGTGYGSELGHIIVRGKDFEGHWKKTKKRIERKFGKDILIRDLCKMKDREAKNILEKAADYIGEGIASICNVLDPEVVVLGGGIRDSGNVFLKMVEKSVGRYSFFPRKIKVVWGKINEPGIVGAGLLLK